MIRVNFLPGVGKHTSRPLSIYNIGNDRLARCTPLAKRNKVPWIYSRGPSPPPCIPEEWEPREGQSGSYEGLHTITIRSNDQVQSDGVYWPDSSTTGYHDRPTLLAARHREPMFELSRSDLDVPYESDVGLGFPQVLTDSLYTDPDETNPFIVYANCYLERNRVSPNINAPPGDIERNVHNDQVKTSSPRSDSLASAQPELHSTQRADPGNHCTTSATGILGDGYPQQNPGFVDTPRGNSGIIHHSTSAFARVPRGLSPDNKSPKNAPDHSLIQMSRSTAQLSSSPQSPNPSVNADSHATYEEAWDVKMTRQLGFGISHLPVATKPATQSPVNPAPPTSHPASNLAIVPRGELLMRPSPIDRTSTRRSLRHTADHRSPTHTTDVSNSSGRRIEQRSPTLLKDASHKGGLLFHENRLFDGNKMEEPAQPNPTIGPTEPPAEYDYAYNGSWCMGVQLNMKLAINGNHNPNHTARTLTPSSKPMPVGPPPQLSNTCSTGHPVQTSYKARSRHTVDVDHATEDRFVDSGDTRNDLTRPRFVDPTKLLHQHPGLQSPPGMPPHLRPLPSQMASAKCSGGKLNSKLSPRSNTVCKPSVLSPNLEGSPLEDQPWYHPSLTRSEAEELLAEEPEGTFLVRNSETCLNDYSLTIKHKIFVHMKISRNAAGQYILGDYSQPYPTVPQMIYHYARTLVPVRGAEYVTLKHPFYRPAVHQ